jgi:hypothetical protein
MGLPFESGAPLISPGSYPGVDRVARIWEKLADPEACLVVGHLNARAGGTARLLIGTASTAASADSLKAASEAIPGVHLVDTDQRNADHDQRATYQLKAAARQLAEHHPGKQHRETTSVRPTKVASLGPSGRAAPMPVT